MRYLGILFFVSISNILFAQQQQLDGKLASRYNDIVHLKKTEQFEEAFHLLEWTLKDHPNHPDFLNLNAMVVLSTGNVNDKENDSIAIELLNKAIQADSTQAAYYNNRGWVHQLQSNYDQALSDFNRAISLDSSNVRLRHHPIRIKFIQQNVPEALELCNKTILKFPKDGYAYYVRGMVLREYVKQQKLSDADILKAHELGWAKGINFIY